jgi:hypothetical protein
MLEMTRTNTFMKMFIRSVSGNNLMYRKEDHSNNFSRLMWWNATL